MVEIPNGQGQGYHTLSALNSGAGAAPIGNFSVVTLKTSLCIIFSVELLG